MAARRLILVLLVLLVASVIAAGLAPDRNGPLIGSDDSGETTESAESTPEDAPADPSATGGAALGERIDASARQPETVEAAVGDQLALSVGSDPAREIAIAPLGLTDFAAPDAPASFNVLLRQPGTYPITDGSDPGKILGRLVVVEPGGSAGRESGGKPKSGRGHKGDGGATEPEGQAA